MMAPEEFRIQPEKRIMHPELTPKQQRLLDYLRRQMEENGRPPTLRQAAADLGVSHTAVAQGLAALQEKGRIVRQGRYSRAIHLVQQPDAPDPRWRRVPVIGRVTAGLPMYAQQQWDGSVVVDGSVFRDPVLFALRIAGDSMRNAGILDGDLAICRPRQYAANGEIVVALIDGDQATVKRFFLHPDHVELRPENPDFPVMRYGFDQVLVQGKVIGIQRGPQEMDRL